LDNHPESEPLGIRTVAQDHRITAFRDRAKHVGAQHLAVVHRDRGVPVDAHAVAGFAARLMGFAIPRRLRHARFAFKR
jgi:hypothetical protein